jgi:protein ImuA
VDSRLPGGGLPLGRWHELAGAGLEAETAASTAAFAAALAARLAGAGEIVWVLQRADLHAPGAAALGLPPGRLLLVEAGDDLEALAALEDALRTTGVAAAVGEVERLDLAAGRRLQLAGERTGATGLVLRRRLFGLQRAAKAEATAAATRWRIEPAPSDPGAEPGLGPARWRVRLERCQGGRPGAWIMEASDEADPVRVVAELADHQLAPAELRQAVG